jgi:glycosyltransferase 2 family protein
MKNFLKKIFPWIIVVLILFFLVKTLILNWQKVKEYNFQINICYLLISFLIFFFGAFLDSQVWHFLLLKSKASIQRFKTFKIHFFSRFGSYVPGKIWFLLIRSRLCKNENVAQQDIVASSLLELGIGMIAPSIISLIFMGDYFLGKRYLPIMIAAIIIGGIIFIRPKIFYGILNFGLKKFKRETIPQEARLNSQTILLALIFNSLVWLIYGTSFYFFIRAVAPIPPSSAFNLIGTYIVSATAGAWAFFTPYGLGVRETTQSYFLSHLIPLEISILLSFLTRIWMILNDIIAVTLVKIIDLIVKIKKPAKT